ncbi:MAG: Sodium Bile acid symporter family protein [bacterium ADurb.Bin429]|nr:MAG: Sodium Bile acid symporter family protein [bacterium ADurb.Bin429]
MSLSVIRQLSWLDRLLPIWIFLAMGLGVLLGRIFPVIGPALDRITVADVSLPIAIGLIWMMYPVLAKVRYESLGEFVGHGRLFGISLLFNWVIGPALMFTLAWLLLPDLPHYRTGLILVGLARCIAMVLVWNMLARGSNEIAAILVALNSVFQIFMYSVLGYLFLAVVPRWFGGESMVVQISMWQIAKSVLIFLGIPVVAGYLTRTTLVRWKGTTWYEHVFMAKLGPTALIGLLYTIVLMFSMQGEKIVELPLDVLRIALPLLAYFLLMWGIAFFVTRAMGFRYRDVTSVAFTAAGNNFELAIAVAVGIFGIASGEALAAVVGPLIEVPALIGLVYVALWAQRKFFPMDQQDEATPLPDCILPTSQSPGKE